MPQRRRLATGIYADTHGISVIYSSHGAPIETRFEPGTPLERLKKWRQVKIGQAADLAPRDPRGSLARDVVRYLKRLKGTTGYKSEKSHLRAWLTQLGAATRRWQITREDVELTIAAWREHGYAARTIRHRCRVLQALYHRLDGPTMTTPLDGVALPKKPKARAVSVDDQLIIGVARQLMIQEQPGISRLRDAKTRARFLVLATTGRRPAEVMRAERGDVDLHRRLWLTRTAKGGVNSALILNAEMVAAWRLFITAQAWGLYDGRSFVRTLQRNGWPKGVRPYNLRHSTAIAIRARGGDLEDVQDQLGHASIATSREFYLRALPARQARISETLAGRFQPSIFHDRLPRGVAGRQAKAAETGGKSTEAVQRSGRRRGPRRSAKTA